MKVNYDPSRRKMLFTGMALLACDTYFTFGQSTPVAISQGKGLAAAGRLLSVASVLDPEFGAHADSLFPGLRQNLNFQLIAPSSIIATNTSGPAIKAVSVRWAIVNRAAGYNTSSFHYVQSGAGTLVSGNKSILSPGETRLITPFFTLSTQEGVSGFEFKWNRLDAKECEYFKFIVRETQGSTRVNSEIDAVVYGDWTLAGPDSSSLGDHLRIRRNAEHDEAVSILKAIAKDPTDQAIADTLNQHTSVEGIAGASVPRSKPWRFWYFKARTLQAKAIMARFAANPLGIKQDLLRVRNIPKTRLVALAS